MINRRVKAMGFMVFEYINGFVGVAFCTVVYAVALFKIGKLVELLPKFTPQDFN